MKRLAFAVLPAAALVVTSAWGQQQQQTPQSETEQTLEEMEQKAGEAAERALGAEEPRAATTAEPIVAIQERDQLLAGKIIGAPVKSGPGEEAEEIGTIEDLLFDRDNDLIAAVIGVGGFLGIGTKKIAVSWDALEKIETNGDVAFVVALSREQLESAPAFMSVEERARQLERQQQELRQREEGQSPDSPARAPTRPAN